MKTFLLVPRARLWWVAFVGVLLVAAVGAAVGSAVVDGSDGVITACYHKTTGALRVIDPSAETCRKTERSIEWNLAGIPGPAGGGVVYADNIVEDVPGGTAGIELPYDQWVEFLTLDIPLEWGANGEDPVTVVTESLDVVNESDVQIKLTCNVGNGTSFEWTIDPFRRDSTSFTAYSTMAQLPFACKARQGYGPPGGVWNVKVHRATMSAARADSVEHFGVEH